MSGAVRTTKPWTKTSLNMRTEHVKNLEFVRNVQLSLRGFHAPRMPELTLICAGDTQICRILPGRGAEEDFTPNNCENFRACRAKPRATILEMRVLAGYLGLG